MGSSVFATKIAWRLQNLSCLYGFTYYQDRGFAHSFEILYDQSFRLRRSGFKASYFGFGFVGSQDSRYQELGLKFILAPITRPIRFSRKTSIIPLAFIQSNWKNVRGGESFASDMNIRLGVGINGNLDLFYKPPIVIKPTLQVGYTLDDDFGNSKKGLSVEFRIGIGLNLRRVHLK